MNVLTERGMEMELLTKMSTGAYIDLCSAGETSRQTKSQSTPRVKKLKKSKRSRQIENSTFQAIEMQAAVGIGKCNPFMEDHWGINAGSNRIVGQECEETGPTNEQCRSRAEVDRSQLVAFYESKRENQRLNRNDKREGGCSRKIHVRANRDLNQKMGQKGYEARSARERRRVLRNWSRSIRTKCKSTYRKGEGRGV